MGSGFLRERQRPGDEWPRERPATRAMEKLRRVLSGQDDEEQGLTSQVACPRRRQAEGANLCWARGAGPLPGKSVGSFPGLGGDCRSSLRDPSPIWPSGRGARSAGRLPSRKQPVCPARFPRSLSWGLCACCGPSPTCAGGWGAGPSPASRREPKPLSVWPPCAPGDKRGCEGVCVSFGSGDTGA